MKIEVKVYIHDRDPDNSPKPWQADIIGDGFDHHGLGETPQVALMNATMHWQKHGDKNS